MASVEKEQTRMKGILKVLKKEYPEATCSLTYDSPFQLAVATILSAQCTDDRVNKTTPALFKKFPTPQKMSKAKVSELEKLVKSTGFFRNKAKNLKSMSTTVADEYKGKLPQNLKELTALPGIGRKTANVILGNAFGIPGLVVDTHVGRLSRRMGFTEQKDPVKVEFEMMEIVPKKEWTMYSHYLIYHGRKYCMARKPDCFRCPLKRQCPQIGV